MQSKRGVKFPKDKVHVHYEKRGLIKGAIYNVWGQVKEAYRDMRIQDDQARRKR